MKVNEICWLTDWQIRFPDPDVEYGARRPEVVGTFLAIAERKNCAIKPECRNVTLVGNVFNYPNGEFDDGVKIMTPNIVQIEHRLLTEGVEKRTKLPKSIFGQKFTLDRKEKRFATFVTTEGGLTFMLGYIGQRLVSSADYLNWNLLRGVSGYNPDRYDDDAEDLEKHFDEFVDYFTDVNEAYEPIDLEI